MDYAALDIKTKYILSLPWRFANIGLECILWDKASRPRRTDRIDVYILCYRICIGVVTIGDIHEPEYASRRVPRTVQDSNCQAIRNALASTIKSALRESFAHIVAKKEKEKVGGYEKSPERELVPVDRRRKEKKRSETLLQRAGRRTEQRWETTLVKRVEGGGKGGVYEGGHEGKGLERREVSVCPKWMGVKMFRVLLACVWLVAGSPLHPWPLIPQRASITRDSYIRHYSPAWYDTAALREHRARSRRDTSTSGRPKDSTLNLRLRALDRTKWVIGWFPICRRCYARPPPRPLYAGDRYNSYIFYGTLSGIESQKWLDDDNDDGDDDDDGGDSWGETINH
ncbi:hypothetical protein M0802_003202 [Mischocyttarus mexicanus]|nr:hypothetical protein M0802_003202 [Mischocyttarus mexicanus]